MTDPIARWHAFTQSHDGDALFALLHPDCVFESPVVHTPQRGRAISFAYLSAAEHVLGGPGFAYVGEWRAESSAILEFVTERDGITINGVDMIWWDEAGLITRFKVMVRPLKAINWLHQAMKARLEQG